MIDQVFQFAYAKVAPETPWTELQGTGQILVVTMRRIGWSAVSPTIWRTSVGTDVEISSTAPREVVALVTRDASV
eukprot:9463776-Pyramimonas_sp.AAC.1